jgi:hypothetical protein
MIVHFSHRSRHCTGGTRDCRTHAGGVMVWQQAQGTTGEMGEGRDHGATLGTIRRRNRSDRKDQIRAVTCMRAEDDEADGQFATQEAREDHFADSFEDNVTLRLNDRLASERGMTFSPLLGLLFSS